MFRRNFLRLSISSQDLCDAGTQKSYTTEELTPHRLGGNKNGAKSRLAARGSSQPVKSHLAPPAPPPKYILQYLLGL